MAYCTQSDIEEQISQDELMQLSDDRGELASTTLAAELSATATSITLTSGAAFPSSGGRIDIGTEEIIYSLRSSNTLTVSERGANNTTAQAHANGTTVTELNYIDSSVITRAIADADAEIDSYCYTQYDNLPFSTVPAMVRKLSVDISIYNLFARRKGAPDDRKDRYKNAIQFLEKLAKGIVSLGSDAPAIDDDAGPEATTDIDDRIFTTGKTSDSSVGSLDNF